MQYHRGDKHRWIVKEEDGDLISILCLNPPPGVSAQCWIRRSHFEAIYEPY